MREYDVFVAAGAIAGPVAARYCERQGLRALSVSQTRRSQRSGVQSCASNAALQEYLEKGMMGWGGACSSRVASTAFGAANAKSCCRRAGALGGFVPCPTNRPSDPGEATRFRSGTWTRIPSRSCRCPRRSSLASSAPPEA
jgi:hypothetical protein